MKSRFFGSAPTADTSTPAIPLPPSKDAVNKTALRLVEEIGPREYFIETNADEPLHFYALGCQGEEGDRQSSVANLMNQFATSKKPHFILYLGDNYYPKPYESALSSTTDSRFQPIYDDVYTGSKISDIPGIVILGNHDGNYERVAETFNSITNALTFGQAKACKKGKEIERFEVGHTYTQPKAMLFKRNDKTAFKPDEMAKWNMPYYFTAYRFVKQNTSLFCLNSNSFVTDFITSFTNPDEKPERNQASWLKQLFTAADYQHHTKLIAMHNPLLTSSKRARPERYDADLYLTPRQIQQMNYLMHRMNDADFKEGDIPAKVREIFSGTNPSIEEQIDREPKNGSYAQMLHACLKVQQIKPDAVFCAHDHALVYNRTDDLCQVISGAGGSTNLMAKETEANDASMGCYVTEPGFVGVTCYPDKKIEFTYRDVKGHELTFNNASHLPVSSNFPEATPAAAYGESERPSVTAARM